MNKNNVYVFGLMMIAAAALGIISHSAIVRVVAFVIVIGSSVLLGISLGSNPFKR